MYVIYTYYKIMTHASCKANKVMTDSEHSLETSHNVQKCHNHEEQAKSEENGYCQCQHEMVQ